MQVSTGERGPPGQIEIRCQRVDRPPDTYSMPFLSLILFPARIVPDGRRQGAAFGLSLDGEAELAERLFENFHTYWWIGKIRIASHAGQDFLADGKNHHGTGIPKAEPDSMEHGVYTRLSSSRPCRTNGNAKYRWAKARLGLSSMARRSSRSPSEKLAGLNVT